MKFSLFLKDKFVFILLFFLFFFLLILLFFAFKVPVVLSNVVLFSMLIFGVLALFLDYFRKKSFYNTFLLNLEHLDKKYLVLETLERPRFYEGQLFYDAFYEINKAMNEYIKNYEFQMNDFKEYIEMWIHEVKIPIASLILMHHNHGNMPKEYVGQVKKLDNYIDQILYYVRSENFEHDFVISEVPLDKVLKNVNLKNKDDYLENNIHLSVSNVRYSVFSDAKWLEFIINQLINNSIKYQRNHVEREIRITGEDYPDFFVLSIYDNGIGIPPRDIARVFEKSFTGENGRTHSKSTGMGLYIAKKLCTKLGHKIEISSEVNGHTIVKISFAKNHFYQIDD